MNDGDRKELHDLPGEVLGHGFPDWPDDLATFAERKAYQRGIAHARAVDASVSDRPCAAAMPISEVYAEYMAKARGLGFANVTSALSGLERRLHAGEREAVLVAALTELLAIEDAGATQPHDAWKRRRDLALARARELVAAGAAAPACPAAPAPIYAVGDEVTYTNQQGVVFPNKIIVEVEQTRFADGEPRYYIRPTDTPWVSFRESELSPSEAAQEKSAACAEDEQGRAQRPRG